MGDWGTQFGMLITHMKTEYPDVLNNPPNIQDLTGLYKAAKVLSSPTSSERSFALASQSAASVSAPPAPTDISERPPPAEPTIRDATEADIDAAATIVCMGEGEACTRVLYLDTAVIERVVGSLVDLLRARRPQDFLQLVQDTI